MPVLFIGHGSPMNGIEDNQFSRRWKKMAEEIPTPSAVLVVSAHWLSRGTRITAMDFPKTIHDFGGFPQALFDVQYPAPGDRKVAEERSEERYMRGTARNGEEQQEKKPEKLGGKYKEVNMI